jgi:CheY-like chemotaxis protein
MRILVIDANRQDRLKIKYSLPEFLYVITLSSFREALAYMQSHHFDIVMLSVHSDNINESLTFLRLANTYSSNPFVSVGMVEVQDKDDMQLVLMSGFQFVLTKPVSTEAVTKIISHHKFMRSNEASAI